MENSSTGSRTILFIVANGAIALDISGPMEVFATANGICVTRGHPAPYKIVVASPSGGVIQTRTGLDILTQRLNDIAGGDVDTIIVAGRGSDHPGEDAAVKWLRRNWHQSRRTCSVCVGAFVLARAGILNDRAATTHWNSIEKLAMEFPAIAVKNDAIFVHDRSVWTSAGVLSGIDLALQLLEGDLGRELPMRVAKVLISFMRRSADDTQHSAMLDMQSAGDPDFSRLLRWISENLSRDLSVENLATEAGMSPRTFARHFKLATGMTPGDAVARIRTVAARNLLASGRCSMKEASKLVGFRAEITLRRTLRRFPEQTGRP